MQDLSGRKLGQFELRERLGRGGMAEVYLAEQISLQRQVAFKVLKSRSKQENKKLSYWSEFLEWSKSQLV